MKSVGRTAKERGDIGRAEEQLEAAQQKLADLEAQLEEDLDELEEKLDPANFELEDLSVRPRKSDIQIQRVALVWTPWHVDSSGIAEPIY